MEEIRCLTIKRLTKNAPTVKAMFDESKGNSPAN